MRWLILALLLMLPVTAHAQSCTPNNNGSFSINGSTLSGSGLSAQQYTAGVVVNMSGVSNSGACFPVTVSGQTQSPGLPTVVQNAWILDTFTDANVCTWQFSQPVGSGNTVVGWVHTSDHPDQNERYPSSVTDNAGNTYNLGPLVHWQPWHEDIGLFYLTNVQGNPNTLYLTFPVNSAACNIGFTEYSGATSVTPISPILVAGTSPSITVSAPASSRIWALGAIYGGSASSLLDTGYTPLIDIFYSQDLGVWGSVGTASASQTLHFNAPLGSANPCDSTAYSGCPSAFVAAAISSSLSPTITVNGSSSGVTVNAGASITVAVSNGPGGSNDWVSICTAATPSGPTCDGAGYSWNYLNCATTHPSAPYPTSGSCGMTAPLTAGNYQAVFFGCNLPSNCPNGGYGALASATFTVTGGGGTSTILPVAPPGFHWVETFSDEFQNPSPNTGTSSAPVTINTSTWQFSRYCGDNNFSTYSPPTYGCNPTLSGATLGATVAPGGPMSIDLDPSPSVGAQIILSSMDDNGTINGFYQRYGFFVYDVKLPNPSTIGSSTAEFDLESFARGTWTTPRGTYGELTWATVQGEHYNYSGYDCWEAWNTTPGAPTSAAIWSHVETGIDLTADFHQYGVLWTNDGSAHGSVVSYFDGSPKSGGYQLHSPDWNNGLYLDIFFAGFKTTTPMQFRWARVYQLAPN